MIKNLFFIGVISFLIQACATKPTKQELDNANYGLHPSESDIERIYKETVKQTLIDPESVQTRNIQEPKKFWRKSNDFLQAYWIICGEVNAKNRLGGYTGFKPAIIWANKSGSGMEETIPGSPGCILGNMIQDVDPCGFYSNQSDFFKCK